MDDLAGQIRDYNPNSIYQNKELELLRASEGNDGWILFISDGNEQNLCPVKLSISRWQFIDYNGKRHPLYNRYVITSGAINVLSKADTDLCLVLLTNVSKRKCLKILDKYIIYSFSKF